MPSPADRLPKRELDALALFARDMAHEAGDVLRRGSSRPRNVSKKGKIDLVTNVDLASESLIVGRIKKRFPEHGILAEENTSKKTESPFRWLIDPLDGTVNFAHGYPHFCVSIALEYRNATRVGVVFDPLRNEMFSAALGRGARLNSRRIQITTPARLVDALCATGFPYDTHTSPKNNLANFGRIMKQAQDIRRGGSAALDLCYLACGRFDAFWEIKLNPWDTAAGALIASEAGAKVTDFSSRPFLPEMKEILACNARLHSKMLPFLS